VGTGFSEKIMLKRGAKARWRFNQIPSRFSAWASRAVLRTLKDIQYVAAATAARIAVS
jgi:hypothetical protein